MSDLKVEAHPVGMVQSIDDDEVVILFQRSSACAGCQACGLHKDTGEMMLRLPKGEDVQIGDQVMIIVKNSFFLQSALLLYVIPLIVLAAVIGLGSIFIHSDIGQIILAVSGFVLASGSYFVLRLFKEKFKHMKARNMGYHRVD